MTWSRRSRSKSTGVTVARVVAAFAVVCGILLIVAQSNQSELEWTDEELAGKPALQRAHRALKRLDKASRALRGQNYGAARVHLERSRRALTALIAKNADDVLVQADTDPEPSAPNERDALPRGLDFQPRTSSGTSPSQ
jgi:hypothetical protein